MTDTLIIWKTFEVKGFFARMREKLKAREPKQTQYETIEEIPVFDLLKHFTEELEEFKEGQKKIDLDNIQEEACDIANLCGMIYVVAGERRKQT